MAGSGIIDVEKRIQIMIKTNENHKEIKTIKETLINSDDRVTEVIGVPGVEN